MSNGQNESSSDLLLYSIALGGFLFFMWYAFGNQIAWAYLGLKKAEYYVLKILLIDHIFNGTWEKYMTQDIIAILQGMSDEDQKSIKVLAKVGGAVGVFTKWIYLAACLSIGYVVYKRNPGMKFKRIHSMKTLAESEQKLWPAIAPVIGLDLINQDVHKGPWAMAKRPLEFVRFYKLLDVNKKLNRERAEKLFAMQLGKLWEGPDKLNSYTKALYAAFCAQACGDIKEALWAFNELSAGMAAGKVDYSWVNGYIKKYENDDRVKSVIEKHAYVYTVMASMLMAARGFGVCASSGFIWLKPKNRALWFILNGVGRRVVYAEVAGIYGHWLAETIAEHPIERPFVSKAVDGLEKALLEVIID